MRWRALMLLGFAATLGACGSIDGGSSGTGITTAQGNVVSVVASAPASLLRATSAAEGDQPRFGMVMAADPASLAGIDVAVEGTAFAGSTDESGSFQIRGRFAPVFTLVFSRRDAGTLARLTVTIPGGGTLTLNDVTIVAAQQSATATSQDAVFDCTIARADCAAGTMSFVNQGAPYEQWQYVLALDGSSIQSPTGAAISCEALKRGDNASVRGEAFPDLTFGNALVTVSQ